MSKVLQLATDARKEVKALRERLDLLERRVNGVEMTETVHDNEIHKLTVHVHKPNTVKTFALAAIGAVKNSLK